MYKLPRLLDINAKSTLFRDSKKLLVASRCLETEKPWLIEEFKKKGYIVVTACPEAEHVNMLGFKLCGILARCSFEEIAVLSDRWKYALYSTTLDARKKYSKL